MRRPVPGAAVELYFASAANNLVTAAQTVEEIRHDNGIAGVVTRLSALERVSHQITSELVRLLLADRDSVPPDRADLYRVCSRIDYAIDHLESSARLIEASSLEVLPDPLLHLIRLCADTARRTAEAIALVRTPEMMPPYWLESSRLTSEAGRTVEVLYAHCFEMESNAESLALREVSAELEAAIRLFDTAAQTMRQVVERWTRSV